MHYVIVGGGIAGVSCAMGILRHDNSDKTRVTLVSATGHVKTISNWYKIGQFTEHFDVGETEQPICDDIRFKFQCSKIVDWDEKKLLTSHHETIFYDKLCIATGASPICPWADAMTIRDTDTAFTLQEKLKSAKHVTIVGNGGIAMELAYELDCHVTWIIKDSSIGSKFFPKEIEYFLLPFFEQGRPEGTRAKNDGILKRLKYTTDCGGCALGPDWSTAISLRTRLGERSLNIIRDSTVTQVEKRSDGVHVSYTTNASENHYVNDVVIWATGVKSVIHPWNSILKTVDDSIAVDDLLRTNLPNVFACGDVCRMTKQSSLWKQVPLWTQARQQGDVCAQSMVYGEEARLTHMYFDLFTHCTSFFGNKIVFLGDYKPERQKDGEWRIIERVVGDVEYVRCVVSGNHVVGALLIGETELEEAMENLILNKTNIDGMEEDILDPNFDLDDFFD